MALVSDEAFHELVTTTARVLVALDGVLDAEDLIEPTGKYFPDEFSIEAQAVARLAFRMRGYTPISADLPLEIRFQQPGEEEQSAGGCGTGACSTPGEADVARGGFLETENGYALVIDVRDVAEPTILTTSIARSLAGIVLAEAEVTFPASAFGYASELTACAMGFGVLVTSGAALYKKGCGGMRMHRATHASVEEAATALALFCRTREISPRRARGHLEITQREAFDEALRLVDSNMHIARDLHDHPAAIANGAFKIQAEKGLFGRLFATRSSDAPADIAPKSASKPRTAAEEARLREAKRLVEEAFDGE